MSENFCVNCKNYSTWDTERLCTLSVNSVDKVTGYVQYNSAYFVKDKEECIFEPKNTKRNKDIISNMCYFVGIIAFIVLLASSLMKGC